MSEHSFELTTIGLEFDALDHLVTAHGCFKMVFLEVKSENERFFYKKPHFSFDCNFFNIHAMFMK